MSNRSKTTGAPQSRTQHEPTPERRVLLLDEIPHLTHARRDVIGALVTLGWLAVVVALSIFGSSTTVAVAMDVRIAASGILEIIVSLPLNFIEGLISFVFPLIVFAQLVWNQRWRTLLTALGSMAVAAALAYALVWVFVKYFPLMLLSQELDAGWRAQSLPLRSTTIAFPYVSSLAALFVAINSGQKSVLYSFAWPTLLSVLGVTILVGDQTLPSALIMLLTGILCGQLGRYVGGRLPEGVDGEELVETLIRSGIDARTVVRVDVQDADYMRARRIITDMPVGTTDHFDIAQILDALETDQPSQSTPEADQPSHHNVPTSETQNATQNTQKDTAQSLRKLLAYSRTEFVPNMDATKERERILHQRSVPVFTPSVRTYAVFDDHDEVWRAGFIDSDIRLERTVVTLWRRFINTPSTLTRVRDLRETAQHVALLELSAAECGANPSRNVHVVGGSHSYAITQQLPDVTLLADIEDPSAIDDATLDESWKTIFLAHSNGISHGMISAHTAAISSTSHEFLLLNWGNGNIPAGETVRRIDFAQLFAMWASLVGIDRALASARRSLTLDQVVSLGPIMQKSVIPKETLADLAAQCDSSGRKALQRLRDVIVESMPVAKAIPPLKLRRFSLKSLATAIIGFIALFIVLGSINFNELKNALAQANVIWILVAILGSAITYVGAAMPLQALTAEKITLLNSMRVHLAASMVSLVAPAGVGPAALNLRFLQKANVPTAVGVATVTLVQVIQFVTTILMLAILGLTTGEVGTLTLPSRATFVVIGVVIALIAIVFLVPQVRRWILAKIRPIIVQIRPRLVWIGAHPGRIAYAALGALIQPVGYVLCFGASLAAFGRSLPLLTLTITYLVSNSVGSVIPSPGGIGPVEAALVGGLTLSGIPSAVALSTALLYRLVTFWGPVPVGWIAMQRLQKQNVL
ncbi:MAG: lysylphosphatidylglycerol synthase transmembrane domain-containing protein [Actinomycetaceae bacterium]|nr:lysylphosphatidylglycerol synthase transmembrane domain-containing protein [Actinomycetaceae bacterium]MDY6082349.1 lysylphosphatidylglycerol synthase transmembrane domain-containing protein [Actinomycetaceae bacterium]